MEGAISVMNCCFPNRHTLSILPHSCTVAFSQFPAGPLVVVLLVVMLLAVMLLLCKSLLLKLHLAHPAPAGAAIVITLARCSFARGQQVLSQLVRSL